QRLFMTATVVPGTAAPASLCIRCEDNHLPRPARPEGTRCPRHLASRPPHAHRLALDHVVRDHGARQGGGWEWRRPGLVTEIAGLNVEEPRCQYVGSGSRLAPTPLA